MAVAYRFVPLDHSGSRVAGARYTLTRDYCLSVGEIISFEMGPTSTWEVVQLEASARPMLGVVTSEGVEIPLEGTAICRALGNRSEPMSALLVPSIMRLMGDWNWWLPTWAARILRLRPSTA